ncbi:MAG: PAS domain-containing protein [Chloroflexota bacterium]
MSDLLTAWREAERRWEQLGPAKDVRERALEVVAAWVTYQDAALPGDTNEVLLVADDEQVYVGVTRGVTSLLGYDVGDLNGTRVQDLAAPDLQETTPARWAEFLADGRQDGEFRLRAKDGRLVSLRFQARAHHPVPGFHMSRLWPDDEA